MEVMAQPQASIGYGRQASAAGPARIFLTYAYLQLLDVMTTLAFLLAGVEEANPVVRQAMAWMGSPLGGLIVVKMAAVLLGIFCILSGRLRLLQRANVFFALLVAWNLCCLVIGLSLDPQS